MVRIAAAALALAVSSLGTLTHSAEIVLLDFWSPACGPCLQMKPTVAAFKNSGYPVREIDVTRELQLARDHNVGRIPCFVMLVDNEEVDRVVGFTSGERIQQMYKKARDVERQIAERVSAQSPDPVLPTGVSIHSDAPGVHQLPKTALPTNDKLLSATVRLRVEDAKGNDYATGTIIDVREGQALVVTCGHLFRESKGEGPVTVEIFEPVASGVRSVGQVPAKVISYNLERDLALVGIWLDRPVGVAAIAPKGTPIEEGDRVVSVGCSNGHDPTALESRITKLDRYKGPPNIEVSGAPEKGRSGGGLFNQSGQLIGVCFAADYEGNEGLFAALEAIHDELTSAGLSQLLAVDDAQPPPKEPIIRGQEPLAVVAPIPQTDVGVTATPEVVVQPARAEADEPVGISAAEQAAWEEIMSRAAGAEVICIIRPKEAGGQSEVITLDDVSPEFVRALTARQKTAQPAVVR
jgi:thiol-disulfide isomerase/thioredoxin